MVAGEVSRTPEPGATSSEASSGVGVAALMTGASAAWVTDLTGAAPAPPLGGSGWPPHAEDPGSHAGVRGRGAFLRLVTHWNGPLAGPRRELVSGGGGGGGWPRRVLGELRVVGPG